MHKKHQTTSPDVGPQGKLDHLTGVPQLLQLDGGQDSQRQLLPCQLESKWGPELKSTFLITLCPQQKQKHW